MIELLLVVLILVLLTTLMWAPRSGRRDKARFAACKSQLERVFIAMQIYAKDSGDRFPAVGGASSAGEALQLLVPRYTSDTASFICPGSKLSLKPEEPLGRQKLSYSYYSGLRATHSGLPLLTDEQAPAGVTPPGGAAVSAKQPYQFSLDGKPPGNNHGKHGGNVLFCDGHVEGRAPGAPLPDGMPDEARLLNP